MPCIEHGTPTWDIGGRIAEVETLSVLREAMRRF